MHWPNTKKLSRQPTTTRTIRPADALVAKILQTSQTESENDIDAGSKAIVADGAIIAAAAVAAEPRAATIAAGTSVIVNRPTDEVAIDCGTKSLGA